MNKKKLMLFGALGLFAIALVTAGVYLYIGSASVIGTVDEPLTVSDATFSFTGYPGTITENIVIDNLANVDLNVELSWVELSNEADPFSLDNSAGTCDNYPNAGWQDECEKRIVLDGMLLSDLETISWDANVFAGYTPHVDLILSNGKSLTFEYDKVADCGVGVYPSGVLNTFDNKGIVDSGAYAWESIPGPCTGIGSGDFLAQHKTLDEWKSTYSGVTIDRIEIEVDNWILGMDAPNSDVWSIVINGNEINVDYELTTTTAVVPIGLNNQIPVTFTVVDDSPVGDFTGVINVRRVASV